MLSAFPLIVGPVLLIAAERHGAAFAARAAAATLLGLVALAGFVVVYAWSAVRLGWAMSLLLAWAAAAVLGLVVGQVRPGLAVAGIGAALAIAVARGGLPDTGTIAVHVAPPAWDLPVRMLLTALLIVVLTATADAFGPGVAGALSALPALASVLAVFTHRRDGTGALKSAAPRHDRGIDRLRRLLRRCRRVAHQDRPRRGLPARARCGRRARAGRGASLRRGELP